MQTFRVYLDQVTAWLDVAQSASVNCNCTFAEARVSCVLFAPFSPTKIPKIIIRRIKRREASHHTTHPSRVLKGKGLHQHPARSLPKKRRLTAPPSHGRRRDGLVSWSRSRRRPQQGHRSRAAVPGFSNVLGEQDHHRARRLPADDDSAVPRHRGPDPGAGGNVGAAAAPCVHDSGRRAAAAGATAALPRRPAPSCRSVPPNERRCMLA
jgi:hypothetical protein